MEPRSTQADRGSTPASRSRGVLSEQLIRAELRWSLLLLWAIVAVPSVGLGILVLSPRLGATTAGIVGLGVGVLLAVPAARLSVRRLRAAARATEPS